MKDIKLADGDINFDYVNDVNEVIQSGTIILSTRKGEFTLSDELGMDRSSMLGKNFSKELAASDVYEALQQDERFQNIKTVVEANTHDRTAKINLTATIGGKDIEMEVDYA